jgi:hypothetical protein
LLCQRGCQRTDHRGEPDTLLTTPDPINEVGEQAADSSSVFPGSGNLRPVHAGDVQKISRIETNGIFTQKTCSFMF